jgi:hypothetical protein
MILAPLVWFCSAASADRAVSYVFISAALAVPAHYRLRIFGVLVNFNSVGREVLNTIQNGCQINDIVGKEVCQRVVQVSVQKRL